MVARPWITFVRIALVGAGYLGVVVAFTWPLASLMTTHLPRAFEPIGADMHLAGWALAWQSHALATDPAHFLHANAYWPHPLALLYGTPGFGLLPAFAPVFLASGSPTLALDAALLLCLALTATTLHLVVARWTASSAAGVVAAMTFLCSQTALRQVGLMPQYAALAALPLVVWIVARDELSWPGVVWLAGLTALQSLTDVVYVGPPLFLTLAIAALVMPRRPAAASRGWRILVALGLAACALAPLYAGYLEVQAANPDLRRQTVWPSQATTHLPFWHPGWLPPSGPLALDAVVVLLVLVGLVVSLAGTRTHRRAWSAAGVFFATGYVVSWVLPKLAPGFRSFVGEHFARDLLRLGFGGLIGACLLAGLAFAACADALGSRAPAVLARVVPLALLLTFVGVLVARAPLHPGAYPVALAPAPGAEATVLREGSGPVLVLPTGKNGLGSEEHASAMYQSTAHWRPLLNGYASYYPRTFARHMALALALPGRQALETLRDETGLRTIVVDPRRLKSPVRRQWNAALEGATLPGARVAYRDATVLVVELDPPGAAVGPADEGARDVRR